MKIADIEIIELQNIPVTPPLFKQPLRTAVRLVKVKTDGASSAFRKSAASCTPRRPAFIQHELAPFLKGQDPWRTSA